jgi:hypothetical protein
MDNKEYLQDKYNWLSGYRDSIFDLNGRKVYFNGCSYSCPTLKLFGYATRRQIINQINKKVKQ